MTSLWGVIQALIDVGLIAGMFFIGMRILRQPKDDPRLSRGLQLLQAKISVLEDLSDRSEAQVNQMVSLLEQKARELQAKIQLADKHVQLIQESMGKSLEVAQIFEDKIPHQEIIERQNTKKYLKAARLANQGRSPQDIAKEVDLPMGEIEFISKVNKEQLMFSEEQLPEWAREQESSSAPAEMSAQPEITGVQKSVEETMRLSHLANQQELVENLQQVQQELETMLRHESVMRDYSGAFNVPKPATDSLNKLGEEFRRARQEVETPVPQVNFAQPTSDLSFFELTPPQEEAAPSMQQTMQAAAMKTAMAQPAQMQAHIEMPTEFSDDQSEEPLLDLTQTEIEQLSYSAPAPAPISAPMAAAPAPVAAPSPTPQADPRAAALAQARAAAQELRKPQPRAAINTPPAAGATARPTQTANPSSSGVLSQQAQPNAPVIRRVEFPRIDGGKIR